jgi:hypothetical protein
VTELPKAADSLPDDTVHHAEKTVLTEAEETARTEKVDKNRKVFLEDLGFSAQACETATVAAASGRSAKPVGDTWLKAIRLRVERRAITVR